MKQSRDFVLAVAVIAALVEPLSAAQTGRRPLSEEERARPQAALQDELVSIRPIAAPNSVWIEELTWMEVRDAIADGNTTVIIPNGGIEQNGP